MKKLIIGLSLMTFLLFGAVGIQSVMADTFQVDTENVDKTPDKEKDSKKAKTDKSKATKTSSKDASCEKSSNCCKSSCSDKSGSKHITRSITRNQFQDLTKDLIDEPFQFIEMALNDCKLTVKNIDKIILAGGQSRMPLIKEKIANYFDMEPVEHLNPEESVALGAAVQSGILVGGMKELVILLDVTPLSLGIETENNSFVKIIEKNTTIPTTKTMAFTTVEDNQRRVKIHVLQGESDLVELNTSLAVFDLVGIRPAPAGIPQIDVKFEIDIDGIVKVTAKDVSTNKEQHVEVNPSSGLTQDEMESIEKRTRQDNSDIEVIEND